MSIENRALQRNSAYGRNDGIDLLRIVSIFMVIILHVLYFGEVLSSTSRFSLKFVTAWFLEMASYGSVNLFAIITGYVYYGRKTRYSKLLQLYMQMLFYTVVCTLVFLLLSPEKVSAKTILYALIPFKVGGYWFFNAYFCLFLFIPFINILIDRITEKNAIKMLLSAFIVFSVLPTVLIQDIGGLGDGYSVTWLAMMYIVGACVKKFDFKLRGNRSLLYYFLCVAASLAGKLIIEALTLALIGKAKNGVLFSSYISPFIVLSSVFLFLFFKEVKLKPAAVNAVRFFSPTTFGVYLIHMEPLVRMTVLEGRFSGLVRWPAPFMICGVVFSAFGIWLVCALMDRVRIILFNCVKIPALCDWTEKKMKKILFPMIYRAKTE